jgi:hypothetical protein
MIVFARLYRFEYYIKYHRKRPYSTIKLLTMHNEMKLILSYNLYEK